MGSKISELDMIELIKSIELLNVNLIKYNFEVIDPKEAPNGGSIEFSCEVNLIENHRDEHFEMIIKFKIRGSRDDDELFKLEEEFNAVFHKLNSEIFDQTSNELQVQFCLSLIYPTLRENALYTLSKAGLGQIHIPFHFSSPELLEVK